MADQGVRLDRNHCLSAGTIFSIQLQCSEGLDHRRFEVHVLILCKEACIAVEGHAHRVVQETCSRTTAFATTRRGTCRGALRSLQEDVVRPVVLVTLRLHKEAVTSHILAVQRAGFRNCA